MGLNNSINYNQFSVAGTLTLTSIHYNRQAVCIATSNCTVTLPSPSGGNFIDFNIQTTSNALVTIFPPSGTIQGQSNFILGPGESCRVYTDGTNWFVQNLTLMQISFFVTIGGSDQSIPDSVITTAAMNTAQYNVGGFFNTSTYTFTPKYPGKYLLIYNQSIGFSNNKDVTYLGYITQTNATVTSRVAQTDITSTDEYSNNISGIFTFNGTTDNAVAQAYQNSGGALNLSHGANVTNFSGVRISNF